LIFLQNESKILEKKIRRVRNVDNSPNLKPEIEEKTFRQNFLRELSGGRNNSGIY